MAERVPRPTDAAKCNWNSDGTTYPSTDPGAPKRATGYKPLDVPVPGAGGIIPANDFNYTIGLAMQMISWARDFIPREWGDIAEGIAETTASQLFRIYPPAAGMYARGLQVFNVAGTATGGGTVLLLCGDGEQIYYSSGSPQQEILAADPADGSQIWKVNPDTQPIASLAADGGFVYYMTTNAGVVGLRRLVRATGAASGNGGTEYSCSPIAVNSSYAIGVDGGVSGAGFVTFFSDIQGTITQDGQYNTNSANLRDCAIDDGFSYVTGAQAGAVEVWCNNLVTRALQWSTGLPTVAAPTTRAIATDGDLVYVGIDRAAMAVGNANLFVLSRTRGDVLASLDIDSGVGVDIRYLAVDDRYLYAIDDSNICHVLRLRFPEVAEVAQVADVILTPVCDGVSAVFRDATTTTNFQRNWMLGATKTFMRAAADDIYRRPFYNLAVPVGR